MYKTDNLSSLTTGVPIQPSYYENKTEEDSNFPKSAHFVISVPPINIPDYSQNNHMNYSTTKSETFNEVVLASYIRENNNRCRTPEEIHENQVHTDKLLPVVTPTGTSTESNTSQGITQSTQAAQIFPVTVQTIHGQAPIILPSSISQLSSFPSNLMNSNIPIIPSGGKIHCILLFQIKLHPNTYICRCKPLFLKICLPLFLLSHNRI